jgi:hypothetical protein
LRAFLGAAALASTLLGLSAGPALAHDRDDGGRGGWEHRGWDHRGWDHDGWRRHEWREHGWGWGGYYQPGYYDGYYAAPRVYYPPPPAYYPGSFNIVVPLR